MLKFKELEQPACIHIMFNLTYLIVWNGLRMEQPCAILFTVCVFGLYGPLWVNESDRKHSVSLNLESFTVWNELSLMCDKKYDPKCYIN